MIKSVLGTHKKYKFEEAAYRTDEDGLVILSVAEVEEGLNFLKT